MTDLRNRCLGCSTPVKMGQSQENMGQSFLAGITVLVNYDLKRLYVAASGKGKPDAKLALQIYEVQ